MISGYLPARNSWGAGHLSCFAGNLMQLKSEQGHPLRPDVLQNKRFWLYSLRGFYVENLHVKFI